MSKSYTIKFMKIRFIIYILKFRHISRTYWGFHEKVTLSYLCALCLDRYSSLNECTLQVPFI